MRKLVEFANSISSSSHSLIPDHKLKGLFFFSTKTRISRNPSILQRVSRIRDPKASIVPVLEEWAEESRGSVQKGEVISLISSMRKFNRFHHALQISQWMTDRMYFELTSSDVAVRLKLVYRVHGLEHAENYFGNLSRHLKVAQTYGALLDCYVVEKSVDKAEAIMHEMKTLGLLESSFAYNWLIGLYAERGHKEKIDMLLAEMDENCIPQDKYTLTNRLICSAAVSDIKGVDDILNQMDDPNVVVNWPSYAVAATFYLKVGFIDRVLELLKKIEVLTAKNRTNKASDYLLTFYAKIGKKDDLYRIWNQFKSAASLRSSTNYCAGSYACMISSLHKVDDIEGAERILDEWESTNGSFEYRVLNQLVSVYCKRRLFEEAEMLVRKAEKRATESGNSLYASTWHILAMGYVSDKQMSKGIESLRKAFLVGREGWKPGAATIASCLDYFEVQRDVEGAEEVVELLGSSGLLTKEIYHRLLSIYVAANKPVSHVLDVMKANGFSADEETEKILQEKLDS